MADSTLVFDLDLESMNEPREWSYLELVQNYLLEHETSWKKCDLPTKSEMNEENRFADVAKSLERKYGTMVTIMKSGKRKRVRLDDFLDPGEGYDTQDSFIDDSEAVDVFVAPNVSTKHGGFYVFEGTLEGLEDQDAKIEVPSTTNKQKPSLFPQHVAKKNKSRELLEKAVKRLSTPKNLTQMRGKTQNLDSILPDYKDPDQPSTHTSTKAIKLDCRKPGKKVGDEIQCLGEEGNHRIVKRIPPLPNSLSNEISDCVANLVKKSASNENIRRGVSKQFDLELLNLASLLDSSNVNQHARSVLFAHIEGVLQLKRKSLVRRIKKLHETCEDQKLNQLFDALSDAIARAMPVLLESYVRDKEVHAERLKVWQSENFDLTETVQCGNEVSLSKRTSKPGPPKKLFRWNNECRFLFQSIITMRLENYRTLNVKGSREEHVRNLFPTLMQLWPEGWITNAALWRAALPVFHKLTSSHSSSIGATKTSPAPPTSAGCLHNGAPHIKNSPPSVNGLSVDLPISKSVAVLNPSVSDKSSTSKRTSPISHVSRNSNSSPRCTSMISPVQQVHQSLRPVLPSKRDRLGIEELPRDHHIKRNVRVSSPTIIQDVSRATVLKVKPANVFKDVTVTAPLVACTTDFLNNTQSIGFVPLNFCSSVSATHFQLPSTLLSSSSALALAGKIMETHNLATPYGPQLQPSSQGVSESIASRKNSNFHAVPHQSMQSTSPRTLSNCSSDVNAGKSSTNIYYQPINGKTTAGQTDHLQHTLSSSASSCLSVNGTVTNSSVLLQRYPPPAHQYVTSIHQRPKEHYSTVTVPPAHLGSCALPPVRPTSPVSNYEKQEKS